MTTPSLTMTVQIPIPLYTRLKQRAEQARRSVEDEILEMVAEALPIEESLDAELAEAVTRLAQANDEALWQVVRQSFSTEKASQLEQLHLKRQDTGLTDAESRAAAELTREYERALFLRAQSMALLMQRGYDVASALTAA